MQTGDNNAKETEKQRDMKERKQTRRKSKKGNAKKQKSRKARIKRYHKMNSPEKEHQKGK